MGKHRASNGIKSIWDDGGADACGVKPVWISTYLRLIRLKEVSTTYLLVLSKVSSIY